MKKHGVQIKTNNTRNEKNSSETNGKVIRETNVRKKTIYFSGKPRLNY